MEKNRAGKLTVIYPSNTIRRSAELSAAKIASERGKPVTFIVNGNDNAGKSESFVALPSQVRDKLPKLYRIFSNPNK